MNHSQQDAVDRLALAHGRVAIRDGFADDHLDVTTPNGACWNVNADGITKRSGHNFSIDWSA